MPQIPHGDVSWPGVISIESFTYTMGHGVSPGVAILKIHPQDIFPQMHGTLRWTDGFQEIELPGCRLNNMTHEQGDDGIVWNLTIVDRRWRWRDLGGIDGCYNQLDPRGKLIPWTIRSPDELAKLCLEAMGETGYVLDLPPGLAYPGPNVSTPQTPTTGTNPPIDWKARPPAQALQELCDLFGRRVVYQISSDSVLITTAGKGEFLPPGSIHRQGPSLKSPETPDSVAVIGGPTRRQMRLGLDAVGEEWDGTYRPIDLLSYAPTLPGKPQISTATVAWDGTTAGLQFSITVANATFSVSGSGSATSIAAALAALINASSDPSIKGKITASAAGGVITLTSTKDGAQFDIEAKITGTLPSPPTSANKFSGALKQAASKARRGWDECVPPMFYGVVKTDRLTLTQAEALARKSVWRCYRVADKDVSGKGPIQVPGYPRKLIRRQQLWLQNTQVDQVVPEKNDANLVDALGRPFNVNLYAGLSRDKPAAVYGSISSNVQVNNNVYHKGYPKNTPFDAQVYVPFTVDPEWQVITFSSHVYFDDKGKFVEPDLALQTAVLVRDQDTNQFDAYYIARPLPGYTGTTNPKVERHPDVELCVTSNYDTVEVTDNNGEVTTTWVIGSFQLLEADAVLRARYYLEGMTAQYDTSDAQTLCYNGIILIDLDGAISQLTWNIGAGGAETVASRNTEHHLYVPPYPVRRRAEYLPAIISKDREAGAERRLGGGSL